MAASKLVTGLMNEKVGFREVSTPTMTKCSSFTRTEGTKHSNPESPPSELPTILSPEERIAISIAEIREIIQESKEQYLNQREHMYELFRRELTEDYTEVKTP